MNRPRRAKSKRLLPLPLSEDDTKCGICLDGVIKRGKTGPCSHLYCFDCLLEWSKQNNSCPQCKKVFRCITKVDFATDSIEEKVFVKDKNRKKVFDSDSEEDLPYIASSDEEGGDYIASDFIDDSELANTETVNLDFLKRKRRRVFSSDSDSAGPSTNTSSDKNKSPASNGLPSTRPTYQTSHCRATSSSSGNESKRPRLTNDTKWARLHTLAKNRKQKKQKQRVGIPIPSANSPNQWISTRRSPATKYPARQSFRSPATKSPARQSFRSPANKSPARQSVRSPATKSPARRPFRSPLQKRTKPTQLFRDPEAYFQSILESVIDH